jgi:glucose-1-phosphate thymidylyltransferase
MRIERHPRCCSGVPILDGDRVVKIEEKPVNPRSFYAVTSMYFYDAHVFDIIKRLKPSGRDWVLITVFPRYDTNQRW